jgi:hypothetical protein
MRISDVLTRSAAETRVMIRQFRLRRGSVWKVEAEVWLDSGNLADWLGDAISRVECVPAHELGAPVPDKNGAPRFQAYLDGELIGEIRDHASGADGFTYHVLERG